jgi:four helix bundle protein
MEFDIEVKKKSTKYLDDALQETIKEANETEYWLDLLYETNYLSNELFQNLKIKNIELLKLLISIINTSKKQ